MSAWFHGTTNRRFVAGDVLEPGAKIGRWSNWTVHDHMLVRPMISGRIMDTRHVVWIADTPECALEWAEHSTLKATTDDLRRMGAGGFAVYEVEPVGLDYPMHAHSRGEACCSSARVIREVSFEPFDDLDAYDEACA